MTNTTMTNADPTADERIHRLIAEQPIIRIHQAGVEYTLLGTAHVSKTSADAVTAIVGLEPFDAIAIELDEGRFHSMKDPDAFKRLDLLKVIKDGKAAMVAVNLWLSSFQRRLAEQVGIEPGAEMMAAHHAAEQQNKPLWLIDREVSLTLARCRKAVGFWGGVKLLTGSILGTFVEDEIQPDEIEKLKQGDILQATFLDFAEESPELYNALIAERDQFMAAKLRQLSAEEHKKRILAVVGAGHLQGIAKALQQNPRAPESIIADMNQKPAPSVIPKLLGLAFLIVLIGGMVYGFSKGFSVGREFLYIYLGLTAGGALLGALLARCGILSALAGAISAPITVLHPALTSGMFSAAVELWLNKPTVADFDAMRVDLKEASGWWKNRVAQVLLAFLLTNFGTVIGVWIATGWFIKKIA
jgi:pheromone shutdown-related protein TraB